MTNYIGIFRHIYISHGYIYDTNQINLLINSTIALYQSPIEILVALDIRFFYKSFLEIVNYSNIPFTLVLPCIDYYAQWSDFYRTFYTCSVEPKAKEITCLSNKTYLEYPDCYKKMNKWIKNQSCQYMTAIKNHKLIEYQLHNKELRSTQIKI